MAIEKSLDNIVNSRTKIAILRLFISKTADFKVSGREIARLIGFSAPAAHTALKELFNKGIFKLDNIGNQHIYSLDVNNRMVQKILKPMFKGEFTFKQEVKDFLVNQIKEEKLNKKIVSLLLYGSLEKGQTHDTSDIDIAIVIKSDKDEKKIEDKFLNEIAVKFHAYFKVHLDVYIKNSNEFCMRLKKNLPPVSTLMKSYSVVYGKDPLEI